MKRRELLKGMGASALLLAEPAISRAAQAKQPLNVLFMGGTGFTGPHTVRALQAQGHSVTLFNRGKTNPGLFPELELIKGDRVTSDIEQLKGRRWDVVVDTSAFYPRAVTSLLAQLDTDNLRQYVFISTLSVYANFGTPGIDETAPKLALPDPTSEDVQQYYGALKYACEEAVETALPGRVTAIRPGIIVGPGDPTDRFTYWPARVARGGQVLAPGSRADPIQTIDARDLAEWVALSVQNGTTGPFNATSDTGETFGSLLDACHSAVNPQAEITWLPHDFLLAQGVQQWTDLPFWVVPDGELGGAWKVNTDRARAAGLKHRPIKDTVVDLHAWFQDLPAERRQALRAGMSAEREAEVLAAWTAAQNSAS